MTLVVRTMYHTQECWEKRLTKPVICVRDDAWLGEGYYFWDDIVDAEQWGHKSKRSKGKFEIYEAKIKSEKFLDTVFNEEHYRYWIKQVERAADFIKGKTGLKPTLKEINEYFNDKGVWSEVDGIIFQDIPENDNILKVHRFYYRKRIQAVVYDLEIITTFTFLKEEWCKR